MDSKTNLERHTPIDIAFEAGPDSPIVEFYRNTFPKLYEESLRRFKEEETFLYNEAFEAYDMDILLWISTL